MTEFSLQRRQTLKGMAALSGGLALSPLMSSASVENDFDWESIRAAYPAQTPFLNFDNGCISPSTLGVQKKVAEASEFMNLNPCYNMIEVLDKAVPDIKVKLAKLVDCDPSEISLNRNTTVGMCTAILGMPL